MLPRYVEHDTLIWEYLNSSIHLAPYLDEKLRKIYAGDAYKFYRQRFVLINSGVVPVLCTHNRNQGCKITSNVGQNLVLNINIFCVC